MELLLWQLSSDDDAEASVDLKIQLTRSIRRASVAQLDLQVSPQAAGIKTEPLVPVRPRCGCDEITHGPKITPSDLWE
jgi:hypothetical protein